MPIVIKPMETEAETRGKAYVHWKSWQETYAGIVDAGFLKQLTLEKCEAIALRPTENTRIAMDGERVVGFAVVGLCRDSDCSAPDDGEIYAVYVLSAYQKRGIGYELMMRCLDMLRGCKRVYLWVLRDNRAAVSFYERLGFAPDGAVQDLVLGTPVRAIRMLRSHS